MGRKERRETRLSFDWRRMSSENNAQKVRDAGGLKKAAQ
jgi:hypothetical protein